MTRPLDEINRLTSLLSEEQKGFFRNGSDVPQRLRQMLSMAVIGKSLETGRTVQSDAFYFKTSEENFFKFREAVVQMLELDLVSQDDRLFDVWQDFFGRMGHAVTIVHQPEEYYAQGEKGSYLVKPGVRVSIFSFSIDLDTGKRIKNIIDRFEIDEIPEPDTDPASPIFVLRKSHTGVFSLRNLGICATTLERDNYTVEALRAFDNVMSDIDGKTKFGSLAIFEGPPGTGKTHMIKALLDRKLNATYVVVPPQLVPELAAPELIDVFAEASNEQRKLVLILEDADKCLAKRDSKDDTSAISAVLNLSDGLVGSLLNLYIIATTNVSQMDFDPAVKRKGRLTAMANIGPMTAGGLIDQPYRIALRICPTLTQEEYAEFLKTCEKDPNDSSGKTFTTKLNEIYGYFNELQKRKTSGPTT